MAKLFGQYLTEKGVVTEEELLQVLMEQITRLPPLHEVLYRNRILPASDLLRAFAYQHEKDVEFKTALKKLNLWNRRVQEAVERRLRAARVPLGQILVRQGRVKFEVMNRVLEEFLAENYRGEREKLLEVPPEVLLTPAEGLDVELVKDCARHIENILGSDLSERLEKLAETEVYDEALCDSIAIDIHRIRAGTHFVGANVIAGFATVLEQSFEALTQEDGFSDWAELTNLIVRGLGVIADFTSDLLITQSETAGFDKFGEIEEISNNLRQLVLTHMEISQHHRVHEHEQHQTTVLLVEPSKSVHRFFVHCLTAHPEFGPAAATTAKDAMVKLKEQDISLVLVEHQLAEETGVLDEIRQAYPELPIVLVTPRAKAGSKLSADSVLQKPFDESDLLGKMAECLEKSQSKGKGTDKKKVA